MDKCILAQAQISHVSYAQRTLSTKQLTQDWIATQKQFNHMENLESMYKALELESTILLYYS